MKNILITGGTGYIGSHTCLRLISLGYKIFLLDSFINSSSEVLLDIKLLLSKIKPKYISNIELIECDLRNYNLLDELFGKLWLNDTPIDGVIHFAGLKDVEESVNYPLSYWDNNVGGTINLLKVMKKYGCKTIIFSSSASVYGKCDKELIDENISPNPISPYAQTKYAVENLLKKIFDSNQDWRIINLRYFNPIAAHPSGILSEKPVGLPSNIFPKMIKVASKELKKLSIFGNDWDTKDGTCIRDYIHVMDIAEGHISAIEYAFKKNSKFININLGTGRGYSVLELISTFSKVNNIDLPYEFVKKRRGDVARLVADNRLALLELNWYPKKNLEDMCRDGWNSLKKT